VPVEEIVPGDLVLLSAAISINVSDEVRASLGGVLSPMGDVSRVMTLRQLVDLHAYVRSVK
jgi:hypothetical protein